MSVITSSLEVLDIILSSSRDNNNNVQTKGMCSLGTTTVTMYSVIVIILSAVTFAAAEASSLDTGTRYFLKGGERIQLSDLPTIKTETGKALYVLDKSKGMYYACNLLAEDECEMIIGFGTPDRFARSPLTGGKTGSGTFHESDHRTSSTCPLLFARMYLPVIETLREKKPEFVPELELSWVITKRAAKLLGADADNFEPLQLIKYLPGQYYKAHHDHKGFYDPDTGYPDRCKTLLLFLNNVDRGGHLRFDALGLEFIPRRGDGIIWSNTDPATGKVDRDMIHQGLPPEEGSNPKYALNVWIRDEPIQVN